MTKHLQQGIESDHSRLKKNMPRVGGFRSFNTARQSIKGFEAMVMDAQGFRLLRPVDCRRAKPTALVLLRTFKSQQGVKLSSLGHVCNLLGNLRQARNFASALERLRQFPLPVSRPTKTRSPNAHSDAKFNFSEIRANIAIQ